MTTPTGISATSAADQFTYPPATHEFNGDGYSGIAWRDTSGDVAVWLMDGGTVAQSAGLGSVLSTFSIIGQHDFDGDGAQRRSVLGFNRRKIEDELRAQGVRPSPPRTRAAPKLPHCALVCDPANGRAYPFMKKRPRLDENRGPSYLT